jgi:hypothetical protein
MLPHDMTKMTLLFHFANSKRSDLAQFGGYALAQRSSRKAMQESCQMTSDRRNPMKRLSHRVVLGGIATLSMLRPIHAGTPEKFSVEVDEGEIALARDAADRIGKRAGVLMG